MGDDEQGAGELSDKEHLVKLEGIVRGLTGMVNLLLGDRGLAA